MRHRFISCNAPLSLSKVVLYGFIPVFALGSGLTFAFHMWRLRPVSRFTAKNVSQLPLRKIHKFASAHEVG